MRQLCSASGRRFFFTGVRGWHFWRGQVDGRGPQRLADPRPQLTADRTRYVYYPGTQLVPGNQGAVILNRPHSITASVTILPGGAEGALASHGGVEGGYTLYVKDKKLHYAYNYVAAELFHLASTEEVPEGEVELGFEFEPTGKPDIRAGKGTPGRAQLYINKKLVGQIDIPLTMPLVITLAGGIMVGRKEGSPITPDYELPFEFTGTLHQVVFDVSGELIKDDEATMPQIMARQ